MENGGRPTQVLRETLLAATDVVYTAPVDCLNAHQVVHHVTASAEHVLAGLVCATTNASDQLTDSNSTGRFTDAMVGMTITGAGIPGATTVAVVDDGNTITMSAAATASAADVAVTFTVADPALASIVAQVRRDPDNANSWLDVTDARLVQQVGQAGTAGLDDGCVVAVLPKTVPYIGWSECRLKLTGHANLPVPALVVKAVPVWSGATPTVQAEVVDTII